MARRCTKADCPARDSSRSSRPSRSAAVRSPFTTGARAEATSGAPQGWTSASGRKQTCGLTLRSGVDGDPIVNHSVPPWGLNMHRVAACSCGQLTATCEGEPRSVVVCSCAACQRRTGSPFGMGAYYVRNQVRTSGRAKTFRRASDGSRWFESHFCPECGTSLYWYLELFPDVIGVAVGGFADPTFPGPTRAAWCLNKHHWVMLPPGLDEFSGQPLPR